MKTKSFNAYLKTRLTKKEIKKIDDEVKIEYREFKEYLFEKLKDPKNAYAYLESASKNNDKEAIKIALNNIQDASDY